MVAFCWLKKIVTIEVIMSNEQLEFSAEIMPFQITARTKAVPFPINLEMLILAREAKGFTQKDLAWLVGCKQSRLSKIESGELMPQEGEIQKFVKVLEQSWDFFFRQSVKTSASVSFYRKTQTLPLKMLRQCNAKMNLRRLEIELQVGHRKLGKCGLAHLPPEDNGGPRVVAQKLRQAWGLKLGAVQQLTKLVEDAGCVVEDYSFPSAKLDGISIHTSQRTPIIFLNRDFPKSRRRLSLAHELGHLVMHTNPHEHVEDEAWDFAAEFLMPAVEIEKQLDRINLDKLGRLKSEWGVSMQAILQRAKKLGKISESYHRFLWIQIAKCGYRFNEPFEDVIPDEKPTERERRLKPDT
jgi:Zn-dependent peptidase ImmA (M78 family)/transcriptional regulator with XRE-family HTH domain